MRGADLLRGMPSIPDDLVAIILEHHENAVGQGYPRRLRDFKMNPLAKIVALADRFCEITLAAANNPLAKDPVAAVEYIEVTLKQPFNKPAFHGLKMALDQNFNKKSSGKIKVVA
jgi:HD-GYP domain-containing protein (c-di-GMP phosphodiesterase class II)